jgi:DNA repair exonuclease SbcCD ATPase subunit
MLSTHQAVLSDLETKLNAARAQLDDAIENDGDTNKARRAIENIETAIAKANQAQDAEQQRAAAAIEAAAGNDGDTVAAEAVAAVNKRVAAVPGVAQIAGGLEYFSHAGRAVALARRTEAGFRDAAKAIVDRVDVLERKVADREQRNAQIVEARIAGGAVDPKETAEMYANDKDVARLRELIADARGSLELAKKQTDEPANATARAVGDLNRMINDVVKGILGDHLAAAEQNLLAAARAVYANGRANNPGSPSTFGSHHTWGVEIEALFRYGKI